MLSVPADYVLSSLNVALQGEVVPSDLFGLAMPGDESPLERAQEIGLGPLFPKCKSLAKRLGEMRRPANQALNLCASLRGEARAATLAGLDQ